MASEASYEELKKQNAELKKQIEIMQLDFVKITNKRKQAELDNEKANIQINQLRIALDNLDTYVYIKDKQSRYLYANQKTLKLFNCTAQELHGRSDSSFFPQDTCKQLAQIDKRILKLGESTAFEVESKDRDGNRRVYWEIKTPLFENNDKSKIIGLCGISTEITERKKVEETIKKNEIRLKELNATKDKLFSIIAHDLRSPFNNIIGFSERLIENTNDTNSAESKKYIDIINSSAKSTLILLDNLLNWAKAQTGELCIIPKEIILSEVIVKVLKLKETLAKSKNISLNYSPSNEIVLLTDENILRTILRNLISNAIKFTNPGGQINVSVNTKQDHVEISISDNGIGINKETLQKLFNLTNKATSLGTANEKGSGLGLVLCREFVRKLGGHIWVESEVGKGSNFKFSLPMNRSK